MLPPRPDSTIRSPTAWATRNMPSMLTDMISRHWDREYFSKGAKNASRSLVFDAALFRRMSMEPKCSPTSPVNFRTDSGSDTSHRYPAAPDTVVAFELARHFIALTEIQVHNGHAGPEFRQPAGKVPAQESRPAGNQGGSPLQVEQLFIFRFHPASPFCFRSWPFFRRSKSS